MNKVFTTAVACMALSGAAKADTTLTTTISSIALETGGNTYNAALSTGVVVGFDITEKVYGSATVSYVTATGVSAIGLDGTIGYMFQNDLDVEKGTGAKLGAGISLGGFVGVMGSTAISPDMVLDFALTTPYNAIGQALVYGVGVEYVPIGIYLQYSEAAFPGYDISMNGFGAGYRARF